MSFPQSAAIHDQADHYGQGDVCSLVPSTSSMATASNLVGPGRVLGKYILSPLGKRTEKALAIAAYKAGFGPVALSERIDKKLSALSRINYISFAKVSPGRERVLREICGDVVRLLDYLRCVFQRAVLNVIDNLITKREKVKEGADANPSSPNSHRSSHSPPLSCGGYGRLGYDSLGRS